mmetsp:Transcript_3012/g.3374  ORF Transcript_3012/g.3374 Transcript_3012/m.3374 type:complete len:208 (+) Transcript_3012:143-766(+)
MDSNERSTITLEDGGSILWDPTFLTKEESSKLFKHLQSVCKWETSVYPTPEGGNKQTIEIPRAQSWMADDGISNKEASLFQKQAPLKWSPEMTIVRKKVEALLNEKFDFVLINLYRDGKDNVGFHYDETHRLPGKTTVPSISIGATRTFIIRSIERKDEVPDREFKLVDGSLVVMLGKMQHYYYHSIPLEEHIKEPRINLTFRGLDR